MTRRSYGLGERVAAMAILVAILAGLAVAVGAPAVRAYRALDAEVAGLRARHAELARRQRDLAALTQERDRLRASDPEQYGLRVADTVDLARAEMQDALQRYASETGVVVQQVRAINAEQPDLAMASADLRMPMDALPALLARISGSRPPIFVDALDIRAISSRRREGPPALSVDLTLASYVSIRNGGSD